MRRITKNQQLFAHQPQHRTLVVVWWCHMDHYHKHPLRTEVPFCNSHPVPMADDSQGIEYGSMAQKAGDCVRKPP